MKKTSKIKIMINGLPGKMAMAVAKHAIKDDRFKIIYKSLTGPEITEHECFLNENKTSLIHPRIRDKVIDEIKSKEGFFICVDYTHPSAVNTNAEFYCRHSLPFVMGTTGGEQKFLVQTINKSSVSAVIAPNMAKQIVGFQAMMKYCAETFPDLFKGYTLEIKESHQKRKADTSGTAKSMIGYFNNMGISFKEKDIKKERDPEKQKKILGIPEQYLKGHGWHTYSLISKDSTVAFNFIHNVNGRDVYAQGTLDAVFFLNKKINAGLKGKIYTMIDVLKGT